MYSFFIGCDMSKLFFDVSYFSGKSIYLDQFTNDIKGFKQMVRKLKSLTEEEVTSWFVCFENTGVYSKALLEWLISQQIPCLEENALKIYYSLGIRRGKDDKSDSKAICTYAFEKRDSLKPSRLPKPLMVSIKKLLSRRSLLVKQRQSLKGVVKEQKSVLDLGLYKIFLKGNNELIEMYTKQIKEIELILEVKIAEDEQVSKNYQLAKSVIGVGPIIASYVVCLTDNFNSFSNGRKFASYCGIAPFWHNQSGIKKGKSKVSQLANKRMKSLLSMAASSAIVFDPEIRLYYYRKLSEGKCKGVVINAIKNKIVHRIFAAISRQSPFNKMMTYV